MQSESLVARFFRWRWAPSVLIVTGALAFALVFGITFALLTRGEVRRSSRAAPRASWAASSEAVKSLRSQSAGDESSVPSRSMALPAAEARAHPGVASFFPATPTMELPPPLEEPEPPPEPEAAPAATEMNVPLPSAESSEAQSGP